jgi:hypothetical protein
MNESIMPRPAKTLRLEHVILKQIHRVSGKNLLESNPYFSNKPVALRGLSEQGCNDQKRREEHEHSGIRHRLGRIDYVVSQGLTDGSSEFGEKPLHGDHWQE